MPARRRPRTPEEEDLLERARRVLPGGTVGNVTWPHDQALIIREGKGARVWDVSGNEYIDYLLGSGPMVLGHAHPAVVSAVREQVERGTTFFATHEMAVRLAEEIVKAVPCAEKVRFLSSGTEATFYALRIARAYRGRPKVLKFEGGFHGMHDYGMMSVWPRSGQEPPYPEPVPGSAGIPEPVGETVLVAPFNDLETATALIEKHHDELAGVILEPFQRVIPPKPGFLQGLREATRHYGIPLIFDEIVTGFRFAYGGAQEYYGVVPDLCTLGKILAGGFPLSAVAGREDLMAVLDPAHEETDRFVPMIGTLNGNPISAVAGLATLRELQKPGTYERLFAIGRRVREGLEAILRQAEVPAQVVGEDPLFEVFFTDEPIVDYRSTLKADRRKAQVFNRVLLEEGVLRAPGKFYISLAHTEQDIAETLSAFERAVEAVRRAF